METCTNVVKLTLNLQKAYRYDQANIQLRDSWVSVDLIFSTTANRLLIGARKNFGVFLPNQKAERRRPFGTGLVRHCPQELFSPFFTFLRDIFFRPLRLSLAPIICLWVSEDEWREALTSSPNGPRINPPGLKFLLSR